MIGSSTALRVPKSRGGRSSRSGDSAKMSEKGATVGTLADTVSKERRAAQRRWRILAKALRGCQQPTSVDASDEVSVRRFASFELLKVGQIQIHPEDAFPDRASWCEYSLVLEGRPFSVQVRRVKRNFTANELIGFNNTGNICVWPSEECLAYYLLKKRQLCRNRRVLELGGGMSCLAGMFVAKYCEPREVTLTDGNATSVNNVRRIVARNGVADSVECGVVQWAKAARAARAIAAGRSVRPFRRIDPTGLRLERWTGAVKDSAKYAERLYDVILCADCLFFDDARSDLVETIYGWLASDGIALAMAPRRGSTFRKFAEAAVERGFVARQVDRYDATVWSRHLALLEESQEYSPDLHYPILLELTKPKNAASE